jgi:hypothetical protein
MEKKLEILFRGKDDPQDSYKSMECDEFALVAWQFDEDGIRHTAVHSSGGGEDPDPLYIGLQTLAAALENSQVPEAKAIGQLVTTVLAKGPVLLALQFKAQGLAQKSQDPPN